MIGDRWRDIEAGRRAGVRATVLVDYGYSEWVAGDPDLRAGSLAEAVDWIIATQERRSR
jgi:D-glycero-D-manno-heptose 1,7-bisphosphate phosphatase